MNEQKHTSEEMMALVNQLPIVERVRFQKVFRDTPLQEKGIEEYLTEQRFTGIKSVINETTANQKNVKESKSDKLRESLFDTMEDVGLDLFSKSTQAIQKALDCTEVSLWTINHNDTQVDGHSREDEDFFSTSLISRKKNCDFEFNNKVDYTHEIIDKKKQVVHGDTQECDCYFHKVLKNEDKKYYVRSDKDQALKDKFKSEDFINEVGINDVIAILITHKEEEYPEKEEKIAILELSFKEPNISDDELEELVPILRSFFSAAFTRYPLIQRANLLDDLIKIQDKHKNDTVQTFIEEVINKIKNRYIPCQGASFFMWDTTDNHYNLIHTTGIVELDMNYVKKEEVFYMKGQGLTGQVGEYGKQFISDNLSGEKKTNSGHESLTCERVIGDAEITPRDIRKADGKTFEKANSCQTGMFIPIAYPNDSTNVVGILRLINKTNYAKREWVDYFNNWIDGKAMEFASKYLSLICDFYIKQTEQLAMIAKMNHELKSPAKAINDHANMLLENIGDTSFLERYLKTQLEDIRDLSLKQLWQATTNLENHRKRDKPLSERYSLEKLNLYDLIKESKSISIPHAKDEGLQFDNIWIDGALSEYDLRADKQAFITIFYNLINNAIKYHCPKKKDFRMNITGYIAKNSDGKKVLRLRFQDNGIGVDVDDKDKIFLTGFRGKNAMIQSALGYGIGLHIIKLLVEDFGGKIFLSSPRNFTVFIIDLPYNILIT